MKTRIISLLFFLLTSFAIINATGELPGLFSVSADQQVQFSQGNLQYNASSDTWRFAENQYDMIGAGNSNISDTYDGWIDLFGWGTGNAPTKSSSWGDDEYATFTDWGINTISNGGNMANTWRTLTKDEWAYLFEYRENASSLYGYANINGINGVVILPDNWKKPDEFYFNTGWDYAYNSYTLLDWSVMESLGAVFLPAAGYREGTDVHVFGTDGDYWSSTAGDWEYSAYGVDFESYNFNAQYFYGDLFRGRSVRLVKSTCIVTSGSCGDNLTWELSCDGVLSINGTGGMWEDMWGAVGNSSPWSEYGEQIKVVAISNGVTYINAEAFNLGIREIRFNGSLDEWCDKPWRPESVAGGYDLYILGEKITDLVIPEGRTRVGNYAFSGCHSIQSVTIPSTIKEWGTSAFNGCNNLSAVYISDLASWCKINCDDFMGNPLHIARHLYLNGMEITGELVIPNTIDSIGNWAFVNCVGITSVVIPEGIKSIGQGSLNTCINMTKVSFPNSLTRIGWASFLGCENLQNLVIPDNVTTIEEYAFKNCYNLETVTFGEGVEEIGSWSFTECTNLKTIKFGNNLQRIGSIAFGYDAKLTSIELPASLTSIGEVAFYDCTGLTSIICHAMTPPALGENVFHSVDKTIPLYVPTASLNLYRTADQWREFTNIHGLTSESSDNQEGLLNGVFTIGYNKSVRFSQGNLQFNATAGSHQRADGTTAQGTWRFAEHQWDMIGEANSNISPTYDGWIDLFCWGTSGWDSGANEWQPYSASSNGYDFIPGGDENNDLTGNYAYADWGIYNPISNGGNIPGLWRTMTDDEWYYLLTSRPKASDLYCQAIVNDVSGLVILPDEWKPADNLHFSADNTEGWNANEYTTDEWEQMENAGAIFLPAGGDRVENWVYYLGEVGSYWSSTACGSSAKDISFFADYIHIEDTGGRYDGESVRLVKDSDGVITTNEGNTISTKAHTCKQIINGHLLILRDGKTFTVQGQEVR